MIVAPLENLNTEMTTPTENPTCKHCGQSKSEHKLANYSDGPMIGLEFLVCPFATFEAKTETNLSGGVEGNAHNLPADERKPLAVGSENSNASPAQNLSPEQEKLTFEQDYTEQLERDNAELRRKLEETQRALGRKVLESNPPDPDAELVESIERLRHEVLVTAEPESGFSRDIINVCDAT